MSDPLVDIAVEAMDYIGRATVRSFTDNTTEAAACARAIGPAVAATLEAVDWNFARSFRSATPSAAAFPPNSRWTYAYIVPMDAIRVRRIARPPKTKPIGFDMGVDYTTRERVLFTTEPSAVLIITLRDPELTTAPTSFRTAAAWALAARVVGALRKGEPGWQKKCEDSYRAALSHAATNDANETADDDQTDFDMPEHLAARGYSA